MCTVANTTPVTYQSFILRVLSDAHWWCLLGGGVVTDCWVWSLVVQQPQEILSWWYSYLCASHPFCELFELLHSAPSVYSYSSFTSAYAAHGICADHFHFLFNHAITCYNSNSLINLVSLVMVRLIHTLYVQKSSGWIFVIQTLLGIKVF